LFTAYNYVLERFEKDLDRDEKRGLREDFVEGMELSPKVGRMCAMNLYLHGIGGDKVVVHAGHDSLAAPWSREYSMVLTNPPFGKKQSPARRHPAHAPHSQSREVGGSHLAFDPAKLRRPLVTVRPRDDRRQARRHLLKIDQ